MPAVMSPDHQHRAQPQRQRLQAQAQGLAEGADHRAGVAGLVLQAKETRVHGKPTVAQRVEHAHGLDGLGIVQVAGRQLAGPLRVTAGLPQGLPGHGLVQAGQADEQQRANGGEDAEPDVEQVDHQQIDREPRRIEEGEQRRAGDELTNMGQVAQGLAGIAFAPEQVALERGLVDLEVEAPLQLAANADDDETADHFQQADENEESHYHQRQHGQRGFVLRRQSAVIYLEHIDGRCQHQNVYQRGKTTDTQQNILIIAQRFNQRHRGSVPCHAHRLSLLLAGPVS